MIGPLPVVVVVLMVVVVIVLMVVLMVGVPQRVMGTGWRGPPQRG